MEFQASVEVSADVAVMNFVKPFTIQILSLKSPSLLLSDVPAIFCPSVYVECAAVGFTC